MTYNLDKNLKAIDGKNLVTSETDSTPFTARSAVANALLTDTDGNKASKMERYGLFVRVKSLLDSNFTTKEAAAMRDAVLDTYNTFISGQVVDILDGTSRSLVAPSEEAHG